MKENQDAGLKEVAERFKVSTWTVHFWLKKLGFRYKKKALPTWRQAKKSEKNI